MGKGLTKEEILLNKGEAWEYSNRLIVSPYEDALYAMSEYAKQEAINFAQFIFNYHYHETELTIEGMWNKFNESTKEKQ
jgi:hypothetical protein